MKKIIAIVKPFKMEAIKEALDEIGIRGMTVTEVGSFEPCQQGWAQTVFGKRYATDYQPRLKLEIVVNGRIANRAAKAVIKASKGLKHESHQIYLTEIETVIRIRTGETGNSAL